MFGLIVLQFIPLDFMRKFNTIGDVNDLLVNFVDEYDDPALASKYMNILNKSNKKITYYLTSS